LFSAPEGQQAHRRPGFALLILTCTGVSFAQRLQRWSEGMGLIILILIGIAPVAFALNLHAAPDTLQAIEAQPRRLEASAENTTSKPFAVWAPHTPS